MSDSVRLVSLCLPKLAAEMIAACDCRLWLSRKMVLFLGPMVTRRIIIFMRIPSASSPRKGLLQGSMMSQWVRTGKATFSSQLMGICGCFRPPRDCETIGITTENFYGRNLIMILMPIADPLWPKVTQIGELAILIRCEWRLEWEIHW